MEVEGTKSLSSHNNHNSTACIDCAVMFGSSFVSALPSSSASSASPPTESSRTTLFECLAASTSSGSKRQSTGNFNLSASGISAHVPTFGGGSVGDDAASSSLMESGSTARLFGAHFPSSSGSGSNHPSTAASLPFGGFGGIGVGLPTISGTKPDNSIPGRSSSVLIPAQTTNRAALTNTTHSVENSCISIDGRSFHSYLYDSSLEGHVIISEFAPFGDASCIGQVSDDGSTHNDALISSSLKITTILPTTISDAINIDPVIGLICIDSSNADGSTNERRKQQQHHRIQVVRDTEREKCMSILPWMCLYTRTSAFVLSIGYEGNHGDNNDNSERRCISGTILHVYEPFEKQLLVSPRGSSILRIRGATSSSNSMFHRCGSMAMLLREEGSGETKSATGYVLALYHGLPDSIVGVGKSARGKDFDGRANPSTEGAITTPLRFTYEDLVRGMKDSINAENAAYGSSSMRRDWPSGSSLPTKEAVDFCFMNPPLSTSGVSGFAATSILVLCNDGSVYGASPIIFDGTVLPRTVVLNAIAHLDAEIDASTAFLQSTSSGSPVSTGEQECTEARTRQCRAARRYLLDAFGIPDGLVSMSESTLAQQGSFYVSASVVHSRSYRPGDRGRSQALAWNPRLQGPLILSRHLYDPSSEISSSPPRYVCIEPFGGKAGSGIIDGFIVTHDCNVDNPTPSSSPCNVVNIEFGILPGEGSVLLPRFEFESYKDCQLIDDLIRGTGVYVERLSIMNGDYCSEMGDESGTTQLTNALATPESSSNRCCCIVIDPLDDVMIHVVTRSRVVTVTTNAVAVAADSFLSRIRESAVFTSRGWGDGMSETIKTKVWSSLEVNSSRAAVVGVQVSGDVHLGHISLARISDSEQHI